MSVELYDFQQQGVDSILKRKYMLLGDEMGLGKTLQALTASYLTGLKTLIVCPAFLRHNWYDEALRFYGKIFADSLSIVSYGQLDKYLGHPEFIIADEAHYLKNPQAKRSNTFHDLLDSVGPQYLLLLTGTPIKNRVGEFWTLLTFLSQCPSDTNGPRLKMSHFEFQRHFMHMESMKIHGRRINKFYGVKNLADLKLLLKGKYLRRKSSAVKLPPLTKKIVDLNIAPEKQKTQLLKAWKDYESGADKSHFMTIKTIDAIAKSKSTAEYAIDILDQDEPVVIFTNHVKVVEELTKEIKKKRYKVAGITGATNSDSRSEIVRDFQNRKYDAIVATIGALSTGVTLTVASNVLFNDFPFTPSDQEQAEKRIHRLSQTRHCTVHLLFSSQVDRYIYSMLQDELQTIREVV